MPGLSAKILAGYWFEWNPRVDLAAIPVGYDPICIAFIEDVDDGVPIFNLHTISDEEFISAVEFLKLQGRSVLISIGGAHGYVVVQQDEVEIFVQGMIEIIDRYGFSGIDLDLEGKAIYASDNPTSIPEAIRRIKDHYAARGKDCVITMAPEFIDLRGEEGLYRPYVEGLEGYYDIVFPQYYNQGNDGIWSDEYHMYLSQSDNEHKAEFLYTLTHAIVTGTQNYIQIPADKFAIGLPATPISALNGYVENPEDVAWALARLADEGNDIRGLMTWSINQDAEYGYEFLDNYLYVVYK